MSQCNHDNKALKCRDCEFEAMIESLKQLNKDAVDFEKMYLNEHKEKNQLQAELTKEREAREVLEARNNDLDDKLTELENSFDTCSRCSITIVHGIDLEGNEPNEGGNDTK